MSNPSLGERLLDVVLPALWVGLAVFMVLLFVLVGLPELLVMSHAAWTEVRVVWGL